MRDFYYDIDREHAGQTVESFLRASGYSKRLIIRLKQTPDGLTVGGVRVRSTTLLKVGDRLRTVMPQEEPKASRCATVVPVVYEDDDLIVCDKPAGIACHRSGSHQNDTLEQVFFERTLRAVYRLDKDTSGLLVLAKHTLAAGRLHGAVRKQYTAVVTGVPESDEGAIELPLVRDVPYEPRQVADPAGLPARTLYRVLNRRENCAVVSCVPLTGRMHQIRAHFAALGHPLMGDALYGGDCSLLSRHALHCSEIYFTHPITGKKMHFLSSPPADMRPFFDPDKTP